MTECAISSTVDAGSASDLVVRLQRSIKAPAAKVWGIVITPETMRSWLGPQVFEPQLGGRVLIDVLHGSRADGVRQRWLMFGNIVTLDQDRELAFTWQEFNVNDLTCWPAPTTVSITLEPQDGGAATLVTLSHRGFDALPNSRQEYEGYAEGWSSLNDLDSLAKMCET